MRPTQEQIEALKAGAAGDLYLVESEDHQIVISGPTRKIFRAFTEAVQAKNPSAVEQLVLDCLVWPSAEEFSTITNTKPFLLRQFSDEVAVVGGSDDTVTVSKLTGEKASALGMSDQRGGANRHVLTTKSGREIVARAPSREAWKAFQAEDNKCTRYEMLVLDCLEFPDRAAVEKLFDEAPFLVLRFGAEIERIGGGDEQVTRKKL